MSLINTNRCKDAGHMSGGPEGPQCVMATRESVLVY